MAVGTRPLEHGHSSPSPALAFLSILTQAGMREGTIWKQGLKAGTPERGGGFCECEDGRGSGGSGRKRRAPSTRVFLLNHAADRRVQTPSDVHELLLDKPDTRLTRRPVLNGAENEGTVRVGSLPTH